MIVVDTNVASELMRSSPAVAVQDWVRGQDGRDLYTTAITVAEIHYGIERLPAGRRMEALRTAVTEVFGMFAEQILPFDAAAAERYAQVVSHREELGLPIDGFDAQIAAICRAHGAALATRDLAGFQETGIDVINPWRAMGDR
jgi:predicted nucleic acid-binding protein